MTIDTQAYYRANF